MRRIHVVAILLLGSLLGPAAPLAPAPASASPDGAWFTSPPLPPEPPFRDRHTAVYDPVRDRMIVYGGEQLSDDVWVLPLAGPNVWTKLAVAGTAPPARQRHVAVFDVPGDRMIVYGGDNGAGVLGDVWELSLSGTPAWTEIHPAAGSNPGARYLAAAVFDPVRRRMIVYGGQQGGAKLADVWALALDGPPVWSPVPTGAGLGPFHGIMNSIAAYDARRDRLIVYDDDRLYQDYPGSVWVLPLADPAGGWRQLWNSGSAWNPARITAVYDSLHDRLLCFGGRGPVDGTDQNLTMAFDFATNTWGVLAAATPPTGREDHAALVDPVRQRMVVSGGSWYAVNGGPDYDYPVYQECVALSLAGSPAWTRLTPLTPRRYPPPRVYATSAFDESRGRHFFFGGQGTFYSGLNDAWVTEAPLDTAWRRIGPPSSGLRPSPRANAACLYDPVRDRFLLIGGPGSFAAGTPMDVWTLPADGGSWMPLSFAGTNTFNRNGHSAVYDAPHDRVILFGGITRNTHYGQTWNDAWEMRLDAPPAWVALAPAGTPPPNRAYHSAVFDPARQRMLVFGGYSVNGFSTILLDDVWELSLGDSLRWTQLFPAGGPVAIGGWSRAVYDSRRDRVLLFTRGPLDSTANPVWELDLAGLAWRPLAPSGAPPSRRDGFNAAYDAGRDEVVMCFGGEPTVTHADAWVLAFDPATPVEVALAGMEGFPDRVELAWQAGGGSIAVAGLWRSVSGGDWEHLCDLLADGTGRLVYTDRAVSAGTRYGYRLGLSEAQGLRFVGEAWVETPGAAFALDGARPNPALEGIHVAFRLADAKPARLELLDVSGRRLAARDVGGMGPGAHVVRLDEGLALRPGLYLVRLTRAGETLTARAAVIR